MEMNNDPSFRFFLDFYADLPRQGPGDDQVTRHILGMLTGLPENPVALDMGCGSGAQTLVLASSGCSVTAVDIHPIMLERLSQQAGNKGLSHQIRPICSSMYDYKHDMPVDLVWSEGAVYIIGFENGLRLWQPFLKEGGYLVVSEMTRISDDPPDDIRRYWEREYPAVQTVAGNELIISRAGYRWLGTVRLPDHAGDSFYTPQKEKIRLIRQNRSLSPQEEEIIGSIETEIRMFETYRGMYGYVFYLMQKVS